ncbi:hypothetical protein DRK59_17105 [Salmonella enterica subsp. diarizonae]|uniref:Uncharacterized protein n=1 Tax=Salmonella enterica subsp. diarizonae serovar 48:i:z TaxID=1192842 RepID=A0A7U6BBM3_SALDZ|nr:hypothetical protein DOE59_04000 [Salmonella enterica subsp. diarizonae serovar 48:i:z]EAA4453728.1 hypothetical protein [Salmonella enterica subsp. diarizonae]EAM2671741.1 hypothetical protein [Salmonella enterica]EBQ9002644.1 hypothetical protein [Salmonella enterica subsp. enterica serovar Blockley]EBQ9478734.1 hypothetical protein [Salmonella enterica subsp. enterica serovar Kokomlemle]EBW2601874.1 hypothetical protein [Salmonella enterica subsp. enterica serovar Poano]
MDSTKSKKAVVLQVSDSSHPCPGMAYMMKSAKSAIKVVAQYLPALITAVFAFRIWSAGHIMSAALLTTLCCFLALLAIAME